MPDLPTLTVTQTQADRMIAAWGSAAAYRAWLKEQIIAFVINYETEQTDAVYNAERESARNQARLDLSQ